MAYQFFDPAPTFENALGISPVQGGFLYFYEKRTTNPKDTWSDHGLSVLNENPVPLDGGARANTHIFLDGEYTVVLKDRGGSTIWARDVVPAGGSNLSIPTPEPNTFLHSADGVSLDWLEIIQLPDPVGSTNQYPVTNGDGYVLKNVPEAPVIPDPEIEITESTESNTFQAGTSDNKIKFFMQTGSASAPASGSENTSVSVTFPKAFKKLWYVDASQTHGGVSAYPILPAQSFPSRTVTGFTVMFSQEENSDASGWNITSPVTFDWIAYGTIEVADEP